MAKSFSARSNHSACFTLPDEIGIFVHAALRPHLDG